MTNFAHNHSSHIVDTVSRTAASTRCTRFAGMRRLDNPSALPARCAR